jgi:hypothetical protein
MIMIDFMIPIMNVYKKDLGESYSILFDGEIFDDRTSINLMELYTNFTCEKVEQPLKPEA